MLYTRYHRPALWLILPGAALLWMLAAPYVAVQRLRSAAEDGDATRIAAMVELGSIREPLLDDLRHTRNAALGDPALYAMAASGVEVPPVEAGWNRAELARMIAFLARGGELRAASGAGAASGARPEVIRRYEGINTFVATYQVGGDPDVEGTRLVFSRRGIGWKLTRIELAEPTESSPNRNRSPSP